MAILTGNEKEYEKVKAWLTKNHSYLLGKMFIKSEGDMPIAEIPQSVADEYHGGGLPEVNATVTRLGSAMDKFPNQGISNFWNRGKKASQEEINRRKQLKHLITSEFSTKMMELGKTQHLPCNAQGLGFAKNLLWCLIRRFQLDGRLPSNIEIGDVGASFDMPKNMLMMEYPRDLEDWFSGH